MYIVPIKKKKKRKRYVYCSRLLEYMRSKLDDEPSTSVHACMGLELGMPLGLMKTFQTLIDYHNNKSMHLHQQE